MRTAISLRSCRCSCLRSQRLFSSIGICAKRKRHCGSCRCFCCFRCRCLRCYGARYDPYRFTARGTEFSTFPDLFATFTAEHLFKTSFVMIQSCRAVSRAAAAVSSMLFHDPAYRSDRILLFQHFQRLCRLQYAYAASISSPGSRAKQAFGSEPGVRTLRWLP